MEDMSWKVPFYLVGHALIIHELNFSRATNLTSAVLRT
jgi:hypothetical protein